MRVIWLEHLSSDWLLGWSCMVGWALLPSPFTAPWASFLSLRAGSKVPMSGRPFSYRGYSSSWEKNTLWNLFVRTSVMVLWPVSLSSDYKLIEWRLGGNQNSHIWRWECERAWPLWRTFSYKVKNAPTLLFSSFTPGHLSKRNENMFTKRIVKGHSQQFYS